MCLSFIVVYNGWTLFVCLTMKSILIATFRLWYFWSSSSDEIDCLRVAIFSTLVRCYWCISMFIIIPIVRWCSLIGPHWLTVVLFDRGYRSFGNFDSTTPIDVVEMLAVLQSKRRDQNPKWLHLETCEWSSSPTFRFTGEMLWFTAPNAFHRKWSKTPFYVTWSEVHWKKSTK